MKTQPSPRLHNVQNDPRLLMWFAIFLMVTMYVWSFFVTPHLLQFAYVLPFSGLFVLHLFLHTRVAWVEKRRGWWLVGYTVLQGLLAFGITWLSGNVGMVFCLFMALVGELLAFYKITVRGLLATGYLLALAFTNFALILGYKQAGWFLLGTIPTIIFVGIYAYNWHCDPPAEFEATVQVRYNHAGTPGRVRLTGPASFEVDLAEIEVELELLEPRSDLALIPPLGIGLLLDRAREPKDAVDRSEDR